VAALVSYSPNESPCFAVSFLASQISGCLRPLRTDSLYTHCPLSLPCRSAPHSSPLDLHTNDQVLYSDCRVYSTLLRSQRFLERCVVHKHNVCSRVKLKECISLSQSDCQTNRSVFTGIHRLCSNAVGGWTGGAGRVDYVMFMVMLFVEGRHGLC
jgi:hypothetical protein